MSTKAPKKKTEKDPKNLTADFSPSNQEPKKETEQKARLNKVEKKLSVIEQELSPGQPQKDPAEAAAPAAEKPKKEPDAEPSLSPSGVVKIVYLAICDRLCDLTGKERFTKEQKQQLVEELDQELNTLDSKWVAPLVGDRPEVRILTRTGLMWF